MDDFKNYLKKQNGIVVIFSAEWCPACRAMKANITNPNGTVKIPVHTEIVDIEKHPELSQGFAIASMPTIIGFIKGQQVFRHTGTMSTDALMLLCHQKRLI